MGCTSSTPTLNPAQTKAFNDNFGDQQRTRYDKSTGANVPVKEPREMPETDFFEAANAGEGDQFMAVLPYLSAIVEPTNHNPPNPSPPDVRYNLEYVYGYRSADSRQNVFFNQSGQVVYMTAALGVILDIPSNTQKFFGGGMVDNTAKNVANNENSHTDDIMALSISSCRSMVVSGQVGQAPCAFLWDAKTGQKKQRFQLIKGSRGVNAIAISQDNSIVACVDNSDNFNVYFFDANTGSLIYKDTGDTNKIFDCCFNMQSGSDIVLVTAGVKHIKFWQPKQSKVNKGIFGDPNLMTSFACCAFDDKGTCYTGGANSQIYVWKENNLVNQIKTAHSNGFVGAMRWMNGKLYTGGKDGNFAITDTTTLQPIKITPLGSLIRAIDVNGDVAVLGLRNGSIIHLNINSGENKSIMQSHSDGEVWGLSAMDQSHVITTGDDNQIICWDINKRTPEFSGCISQDARNAPKGKASTLSTLPASQCARAVAYNPSNGHIAIGHNDGTLTIKNKSNLNSVIHQNTNSKEWIEVIRYSPDGSKLAVGSHDNGVYVYNVQNSYSLIGRCGKSSSFIVSVDWSLDGKYLRVVSGAHELLFFTADNCQQDPSGAQNTKGMQWFTNSAKFGWLVDGIFPSGVDGTHINSVEFSKDDQFIVTGDDYGLVNIFRNPCRKGHKPISLRGHSEHVVRTLFHNNDEYIFSVGGYDQTVMQFKRC